MEIGYLSWSSLHHSNRETDTAMYYSFAFLLAWYGTHQVIISYHIWMNMRNWTVSWFFCNVGALVNLVIHVWSIPFHGFSLPGHLDARFFMVGALVMFTVRLCNNTHRVQLQLLELKGLPLKKNRQKYSQVLFKLTQHCCALARIIMARIIEEFEYK